LTNVDPIFFADIKVYLMAEVIPDGIKKVQALKVTVEHVSNRKVCVIDTGYDINHPDLPAGNHVTGSTGSAGEWNKDEHGHGTHCAGTIAAIGGNHIGVVGVVRSGAMKFHIVTVFNNGGNWAWGFDLLNAVRNLLFLFCYHVLQNDCLTA
jgi:serine protease